MAMLIDNPVLQRGRASEAMPALLLQRTKPVSVLSSGGHVRRPTGLPLPQCGPGERVAPGRLRGRRRELPRRQSTRRGHVLRRVSPATRPRRARALRAGRGQRLQAHPARPRRPHRAHQVLFLVLIKLFIIE